MLAGSTAKKVRIRPVRPSAFVRLALPTGNKRFGGFARDDAARALCQHDRDVAHFLVCRRQRTSGEILVREVEHVIAVSGIEKLHPRRRLVAESVPKRIAAPAAAY